MGGGLEADLSHGAVVELWRSPASRSLRPVLQVADVRHMPDGSSLTPAPGQRYRLDLSDGVHLQPGTLAASLNRLVRDVALRRGTVVRLLDFVCDYRRRTIIVIKLEILQTECSLIGSLKRYEPTRKPGGFTTRSMRYALGPDCEPHIGGRYIQQSCIAYAAEKRANGLSYHGPCRGSNPAGENTLSSVALLAEPTVWKMVGQINDEYLGYLDEPDFITVKAVISFINTERLCTAACPLMVNGTRCNVKATGNGDRAGHCKRCGQMFESCDYGAWYCKRCGHSFDSCDYGYLIHVEIQDHTGATYATVCEEAAKAIFGHTAKDLYLMEFEKQDYKQLDDIILGVGHKPYVLKLKVEAKPFSDGNRVECVVLKAEMVNPSAESRRLLGVTNNHLQEGLGSCCEFGNSMPTYSGWSDFKGRSGSASAVLSTNSGHAASPGRARWWGSSDRFGEQVDGYAVEPDTLSAFGACKCGDHGSDIDGRRSSSPNFFVDRFYDALPAANIADRFGEQVDGYAVEPDTLSAFGACRCGDHGSDIVGRRSSSPDFFVDRFYDALPAVNIAPDIPCIRSKRTSARRAAQSSVRRAEWSPGEP